MNYLYLSISCLNLIQLDLLSKSDAQAHLYLREKQSDTKKDRKWKHLGKTEVIRNNNNPKFTSSFSLEYKFEEKQDLKIVIFDIDSETSSHKNDQDYIGKLKFTLGEVMGCRGCVLTKPLHNKKHRTRKNGHVSVRAEEVSGGMGQAEEEWKFYFACKGLAKKDLIGSSDPYIVVSKINHDSTFTPIYKSETIKQNLNPTFEPFTVTLSKLCGHFRDRTVRIEVYDWDLVGAHDFIGYVDVQMQNIKAQLTPQQFDLIDPKNNKKTGTLIFAKTYCTIIPPDATFLDFLQEMVKSHSLLRLILPDQMVIHQNQTHCTIVVTTM